VPPLVAVPSGTYLIGSEAPSHSVKLPPFEIGRFPVTNAEWGLFMRADGYKDERWWDTDAAQAWRGGEGKAEGAKQQWRKRRHYWQQHFDKIRKLQREGKMDSKQARQWERIACMSDKNFERWLEQQHPPGHQTQPVFWNDNPFNSLAQPVVDICWFEARAYCAWLTAQTGQSFRLPSEAEWEAAARGTKGRRYAWGDTFDAARCNIFETHIRSTTPIGIFPQGDTPEGLSDMTGNVWEWTNSLHQPYPYQAEDGREDPEPSENRVVRGGSWFNTQVEARAASRFHVHPNDQASNLGFRVVCSSHTSVTLQGRKKSH
jgi:formylglycine-generating enzyme required for sulfatase activity